MSSKQTPDTVKDAQKDARGAYVSARDYKRPSERIFRRSRAARDRRKRSDKSDFRFISLLLQLCVLAAMILVAAGVFAQRFMQPGAQDAAGAQAWFTPVFAGLSLIEISGIGILIIFGCVLWLSRKR